MNPDKQNEDTARFPAWVTKGSRVPGEFLVFASGCPVENRLFTELASAQEELVDIESLRVRRVRHVQMHLYSLEKVK
jgi:hypothetical protein